MEALFGTELLIISMISVELISQRFLFFPRSLLATVNSDFGKCQNDFEQFIRQVVKLF